MKIMEPEKIQNKTMAPNAGSYINVNQIKENRIDILFNFRILKIS